MGAVLTSTTEAWEWRATGTSWRVLHSGGVDGALASAVARAVELDEARWSRFRAGSDVSRMNAAAGRHVEVSRATVDLLEACVQWNRRTRGVFQPLIGGALVAWGYRRGLQEAAAYAPSSPAPRSVSGRIEVSRRAGTARIPAGTRIDLGGIAKSWMAARAAALVSLRCADPAVIVDAGGDLVVARGDHVVTVEDPEWQWAPGAPLVLAHVDVRCGQGIATSGFGRRQWRNGDGRRAHHLIDPATGEPGPLAHATVVADDPVAADVLAKALALRPDRVEAMREAALVVVDGRVRTTPAWEAVTRR